jgi:type IV secretion system protein VirB1
VITPALAACAPYVAPPTLEAVISVESGGNPLAIHVNNGRNPPAQHTPADAARVARELIEEGYNVDLGLMQVNSRNLSGLGYSVEQMFDACTNIRAGAGILAEDYGRAVQRAAPGQPALRVALSLYNTGSPVRGFDNGYVARYYINFRPSIIHDIAGPTGRLKDTNPYQADTEVEIPDSYFRAVAALK